MFLPSKSVLHFGAGAFAIGVLILAAPRAARAIAATLVQVTNTPANPAITQGTEKQAAQLVDLFAQGSGGFYNVLPSGNYVSGYTIPSNQYLAITGVDVTPPFCSGTVSVTLITSGTLELKTWYVAGGNTTHFDYPSGIVLAPGLTPTAAIQAPSGCFGTFVQMHGYLTAN
jgi:hypothetical protein